MDDDLRQRVGKVYGENSERKVKPKGSKESEGA